MKQKFSEGEFTSGLTFSAKEPTVYSETPEGGFLIASELLSIEDAQLFAASKDLLLGNIALIKLLRSMEIVHGWDVDNWYEVRDAKKAIAKAFGEEEFQDCMLEVDVK